MGKKPLQNQLGLAIIRTLLSVLHLAVLLALGATALNAYVSPSVFVYLNLLSLAFPFLMILHVLLCLFWIFSRKKRIVFFLVASLFLVTPARRWINFTKDKNRVKDFKVLTFNNKVNTYGKENVEDYINSLNADIVFLQEAGYANAKNPELQDMPFEVHHPIISFYSKYKILEHGSLPVPEIGEALYADVKIKGRIVRFINVYLEPFKLKKSMVKPSTDVTANEQKAKGLVRRLLPVFTIHQEQVTVIRDFVEASPYPVVLAGDFNAMPNSYEYYSIESVLQDAFVESGNGFSTSFHDYKFPIRIDYIFSSNDLEAKKYEVDRSRKLSDHFPVTVGFRFTD